MEGAFYGANPDLVIKATDTPVLIGTGVQTTAATSMRYAFANIPNLTGNFENWNTSTITDMSYLFAGATNFNRPLTNWDTSKVMTMTHMFDGAASFDQPLTTNGNIWNVSIVKTMEAMFQGATMFNQNLSSWDVNDVKTMVNMFNGATNFNNLGQDTLGNWDVGNVTMMTGMFNGATNLTRNLSTWCVIQIASEPANFAPSSLVTANRPHWGECETFAGYSRPFVMTWNGTASITMQSATANYTVDR